jgi:hypothetical protein
MAGKAHIKRDAINRLEKAVASIDEIENIIKRFRLTKKVLPNILGSCSKERSRQPMTISPERPSLARQLPCRKTSMA